MAAGVLAVVASGLALFVVPGALVVAAAGGRMLRGDSFACAFALSLALLAAAFAGCLAVGASIDAAPMAVAAATAAGAALALALRRTLGAGRGDEVSPSMPAPECAELRRTVEVGGGGETGGRFESGNRLLAPGSDAASTPAPRAGDRIPPWFPFLFAIVAAACVGAAVAFAPLGSVDRWWYLAYAQRWAEAPALDLAEPFLGTGMSFARFGVHPWLFGLAAWARLSGVDVVTLWGTAAGPLVVLASMSAAHALATTLFARGALARLTLLATALLWSGGLLPVLARAAEDKILAVAALLPVSFAALLRVVSREGHVGERASATDFVVLAGSSVAIAAVHGLDYALMLLVAAPVAALAAWRSRSCAALAALALVVAVALAPAASGFLVRERLDSIGADLASPDHPVVRVHEGRLRMVALPWGGFVVSPRLLLHPFSLLAGAGFLVLLSGRRRRAAPPTSPPDSLATSRQQFPTAGIDLRTSGSDLVVVATALPLLLAFVPPLPSAAAMVLPPWMVYRVLWLLPVAPLAAIAAHRLARSARRGEAAAALLLLAAALPAISSGVRERVAESRARVAAPQSATFREMLAAVAALPDDALVVAAPELAERLPGLAGRRVVAGLDRSTIVFSGSREAGEARLRARAALLLGDDDALELAAAAGVKATHAVFDPGASSHPRCDGTLFEADAYALCALAGPADGPQSAEERSARAASGRRTRPADAKGSATEQDTSRGSPGAAPSSRDDRASLPDCLEAAERSRRDPWTAAPPLFECRLAVPTSLRGRSDVGLSLFVATGRAADEVSVRSSCGDQAPAESTTRLVAGGSLQVELPALHCDAVRIRVASLFLPAVRATRFSFETPASP